MKVWIVNHYAIPPSLGGLVRHYYFSKYLQAKKHSVRIFTSSKIHNTDINMIDDKSLFKRKIVDDVEYTFVRSKNYSGNGMDRIVNLIDLPFKTWKTMKKFYKREVPDIIYTSSPDLFVAFFALLFGRKHRIPVVVEVRDLWPESIVEYQGMSKNNPVIRILYCLEKWIYTKSDSIIFTMEGGKEYIMDKGWDKRVSLKKVFHVNNGVDLKEYQSDIEQYRIEDADLDDKESFKVIYVGSIRTANNVRSLVETAEVLQKRGEKGIKILIFGEGTDKKELEELCKTKKLSNICFKGSVDKKYIPYILTKSNLNILNYKRANTWKYGGSQNKQFEYLASGRPICANIKMGYSIIEREGCGIETDISDAAQYADIITAYNNMDEKQYQDQCHRAKKAAEKYDYNVLGEEIEKILQETMHKK